MSASIIIEYGCDEIQAAMAVALLQFKNKHGLTYKAIGKVIEREPQSVQQYICSDTEMPATCWLRLTSMWPELNERLTYHLDAAEKAFQGQRSLTLPMPAPEEKAA